MKTISDGTKKVLKIVNIVILFAAIFLMVLNIINDERTQVLGGVIQLLSLLCAGLYCLYGYKKNAAVYYKVFLIGYLIARLLMLYVALKFGNTFSLIGMTIVIICLVILAAKKDLGKKKSVILGLIILVQAVVQFVFALVVAGPASGLRGSITEVVIAIILNLSILAKYEDKAERGTT